MRCHSSKAVFLAVISISIALAAGTACAQDAERQAFVRAIENASVAEPSEVYDKLVAITPGNPLLVREGDAPDGRVRMVSWMSEETFQRFWSQPESLPADTTAPATWAVQIWATAVPQVRTFCTAVPGDAGAVTARVKQYLGLNPDRSYARFVEYWVSPADLIRPCPDSEVTDAACGLDLPADVTTDYRAWFTGNYYYAYSVKGAPWTRLGYTFDWASPSDTLNPVKPVGASEFILRPGAPYTIAARYTTAEYCGRN